MKGWNPDLYHYYTNVNNVSSPRSQVD